ncbi:MAG TPA: di-trans,poly-cis-decaprenylcistransferase, partial [Synergistetes bacterium]|nr:di-trans,poly-cis-decaprenylcistransferase [Synergistota bacterium]
MNHDNQRELRIPAHIAIIMDGNGRWASSRGMSRLAGHQEGARTVERIIMAAVEAGVKYLSLYAFSTENWKRPATEIEGLIALFRYYLKSRIKDLKKNGVRIIFSGRKEGLPQDIVKEMQKAEIETADGQKLMVIVCLNYGGRQEIADAFNLLVKSGSKGPFSEKDISSALYLPEIPDPDLVIRTSGEKRLSNFLLWETAYSELYFTDVLWPDFRETDLNAAIQD